MEVFFMFMWTKHPLGMCMSNVQLLPLLLLQLIHFMGVGLQVYSLYWILFDA
jgi:hypothetical protein